METIFPDADGVSGALLLGWRRRPGSGAVPDSIEQVVTVVLKRAYSVTASAVDPASGSLTPDPAGPVIFEGDQPASILTNGDFADGLAGWSTTGGARATAVEGGVALGRSGGAGDLRRTASLGRQLRGRTVRLVVEAAAQAGLAPVLPVLAAGATSSSGGDGPAAFPAEADPPTLLSTFLDLGETVTATGVSVELQTLGVDGDTVTYANALVNTVDYESDLVADKPEGDLVVIADAPPAPLRVFINGTVRMSQAAQAVPALTGLGWEPRVDTVREDEGGDFLTMTQPLPDDFQNLYYNGYRRAFNQGGPVPHLVPGDEVEIERVGGVRYGFTLPTEAPTLRHAWFVGQGVDDPCLWRSRTVPFALDTLVVEPDRDVAYAVWRAVWPVDIDPDGSGPIPLDANRRLTVTLEGA
jgi:hypothetical protein